MTARPPSPDPHGEPRPEREHPPRRSSYTQPPSPRAPRLPGEELTPLPGPPPAAPSPGTGTPTPRPAEARPAPPTTPRPAPPVSASATTPAAPPDAAPPMSEAATGRAAGHPGTTTAVPPAGRPGATTAAPPAGRTGSPATPHVTPPAASSGGTTAQSAARPAEARTAPQTEPRTVPPREAAIAPPDDARRSGYGGTGRGAAASVPAPPPAADGPARPPATAPTAPPPAREGHARPPAAEPPTRQGDHARPSATEAPGGQARSAATGHPLETRAAGHDAPPLHPGDRQRLLDGSHHDPHGHLGAHALPGGGVVVRVLRPFARSVAVTVQGRRTRLRSEGDGFFTAVLPLREVPEDYRLLVAYDGEETELHDPYRFLPALGDLDLHLISEGRHEQLWQALGARPMTHQGVTGTRFTVWAPNARGVRVIGDFNYWDGTAFPMRSLGHSGVWELFLPGIGEGTRYKFEITRPDGSHTQRADPMARRTECPPANASIVHVSHHTWRDAEWMARRDGGRVHQSPFSVYEVHLPSWRPGLSYRRLAEELPAYVKDLGFTHVEFMPVAEHPFGGSWGYQVTGFYAPTARLGTPDDFKYLVDALHQAGIGVLVDWVPAHFPRDEWALAAFDGTSLYEHADPQRAAHPDWGTLEFDYGRTEVRNFLVANAVYWCQEFHIDGLRVDAVASMLYLDYSREDGEWSPNALGGREDLDAVSFLQEMNATVYRRCPGVVTIAEESTAWNGVTRATHHVGPDGFGGLGFGLKWNMGWMHDSLGYVSHEPVHRKYHHHEMTFSMVYAYSENYVLPISHDEVVHGKQALVSKLPGDWWQRRATHRAYLGFMWAHPGKQLLFMGQEFAQGAEWSHETGPEWWLLDDSYHSADDHRGVQDLVRDLNRRYTATPALWQRDTVPDGFAWVDGDAWEDNVFAFLRFDAQGSPLLAVSNFSPVVRHEYRAGVPERIAAWREVLNTDATAYGGSGVTNPDPLKADRTPWHGRPTSIQLTLPPLATIWLRPA